MRVIAQGRAGSAPVSAESPYEAVVNGVPDRAMLHTLEGVAAGGVRPAASGPAGSTRASIFAPQGRAWFG
jgi:hypothetical protein